MSKILLIISLLEESQLMQYLLDGDSLDSIDVEQSDAAIKHALLGGNFCAVSVLRRAGFDRAAHLARLSHIN